jgi:hypothetical protein
MLLQHPSADQLRDRSCCPAQAEPDITCSLNGVAYPPSNRKLTYMPQRLDRLSFKLTYIRRGNSTSSTEPSNSINMSTPPAKTDSIIIVGAGIFGLSTAIHLARRGYTNVTVFDKQPYEKTLYSYTAGCDAASAGSYYDSPTSQLKLMMHRHQQDNSLCVWSSNRVPRSQRRSSRGLGCLECRAQSWRLVSPSGHDVQRRRLDQQWLPLTIRCNNPPRL